jgi:serine/threonine-protein kinase RsbW
MRSDSIVRLSFPAKPDYLLLARLALSGLARQVPVEEEVLADLKLAVTEACGNAVRHAYREGDGGAVSVSYAVRGGALELIVEDQGAGMEAADVPTETVSEPLEGGMGLSIIRAIVDELEIEAGADGRGTVVRMRKQLGAAPV